MDYRFPQVVSRDVTRLCMADGSIRKMQPLPNSVVRPAVAASSALIAVLGGMRMDSPVSACHIFSLRNDRLVCHSHLLGCLSRGSEWLQKRTEEVVPFYFANKCPDSQPEPGLASYCYPDT